MRVVLIGAGNLATHLGRALVEAGHDVPQVWSRTQASASALAAQLGAEALTDVGAISMEADAYVFALKDSALESVIRQVCPLRTDGVFFHTAGSMPMDVFADSARHYGVFYPMQTFSKQKAVDFSEIPVFVEASDERTREVVGALAESVSRRVSWLSSADRKYLHLAAVFACNFANHCFAVSEQLLKEHGLAFDVMLPLIDETVGKVHQMSPAKAQTGPAVRFDENVIQRHEQLLAGHGQWQQMYELMSRSIHQMAQQ